MNQTPRKRVIAAAICLGIVTAALAYVYFKGLERKAHAEVPVVTAKTDIATGTIVNAGMVEMKEFPADLLPPAPATQQEAVVGMVALTPIKAGSPISQKQVAPKHRLSHIVPPLMRAVTVALDPITGVAGFLKPGDRVDVLATFKVDKGAITKTVLQNVELLATGSEVVAEEIDPETGKPAKSKEYPNATLAVLPSDAEKLILAESRGTLRLTLRGAEDTSYVRTKGVTSRSVIGFVPPDVPEQKPAATSAQRPPAPRPVERPAPLPEWIGPLPAPNVQPIPEPVKKVQVVRGTKLEETVIPE